MNVVLGNSKPMAVTDSADKARRFAYRKLGVEHTDSVRWTDTGKLIVNERWTGLEVKEVASI